MAVNCISLNSLYLGKLCNIQYFFCNCEFETLNVSTKVLHEGSQELTPRLRKFIVHKFCYKALLYCRSTIFINLNIKKQGSLMLNLCSSLTTTFAFICEVLIQTYLTSVITDSFICQCEGHLVGITVRTYKNITSL